MKTIRYCSALWLALVLTCLFPTGALAEGHHQSGIAGQLKSLRYRVGDVIVIFPIPPGGIPRPGRILVHSASGRLVADVLTDSEGYFVMAAKPGDYTVTPLLPPIISPYGSDGAWLVGFPSVVRVAKKEYTETVVYFIPAQ